MLVALAVLCSGFTFTGVVVVNDLDATSDRDRRAFETVATDVAASLRLELQRQNDLVVGAAAFAGGNPDMDTEDLTQWVTAVRAVERYPALWGVTFVAIVPHEELGSYVESIRTDPAVLGADEDFQIIPEGPRDFYCFLQAIGYQVEGSPQIPPGYDYCADPALAAIVEPSIHSGQSGYQSGIPINDTMPLIITTPVYVDGIDPGTPEERVEQYLGGIATVVDLEWLLGQAVEEHTDLAAELRYSDAYVDVTFAAGSAEADGHAVETTILDGWQLTLRADSDFAGLVVSSSTLVLLGAGTVVPILLAVLLYVLGTTRARALDHVDEATAELRHQALHDTLTGLPNRALIADRAEALLTRGRRERSVPAAMFVDLDGFKEVNDSLGHGAGDELLKAVSGRLTRALRGTDTIGRLGGDEFVVLVDGATIPAGPEVVAERLLASMREPFLIGDEEIPVRVTASVGIAVGDRDTADELLRDADIALYEAKAAGRDCWRLLGAGPDAGIRHRVQLENDLRRLDPDESLRLVYQPIYDLAGPTVVGVEALLRWDHPTLGEVSPTEFVPVLERTGQIMEVGRWVLDHACAQLAEWRAAGMTLGMSVNVSARQLENQAFPSHVAAALEQSGIEASALTIEITETALMADPARAVGLLQDVKALGVQIAVDDFGTGYSSLAYLQRFPIDCLKIDREFVEAIGESPDSQALVHTLVALGRQLGIDTLAEGVETIEQFDRLRLEEVDEAQGFLLARPLASDAVRDLFHQADATATNT